MYMSFPHCYNSTSATTNSLGSIAFRSSLSADSSPSRALQHDSRAVFSRVHHASVPERQRVHGRALARAVPLAALPRRRAQRTGWRHAGLAHDRQPAVARPVRQQLHHACACCAALSLLSQIACAGTVSVFPIDCSLTWLNVSFNPLVWQPAQPPYAFQVSDQRPNRLPTRLCFVAESRWLHPPGGARC